MPALAHPFRNVAWRLALPCGLLTLLGACQPAPEPAWSGYAEGDYVYIAAPVAGTLRALPVQKGQTVAAQALLFSLDDQPAQAARAEADARLDTARHQADDSAKGRRRDEIAVTEAQLAQARAQAERAQTEWQRNQQLVNQSFVSRSRLDDAATAARQAQDRVDELQAALRVARLPARSDEQAAAQASRRAAAQAREQALWREQQARQYAPTAGLVADTFFRVGEYVNAGQPVLALLPPRAAQGPFLRARGAARRAGPGAGGEPALRRLRRAHGGAHQLHLAPGRIHAAGDLLQQPARAPGVSGRSLALPRRCPAPAAGPAAGCARGRERRGQAMNPAPDGQDGPDAPRWAIDVRGLTKRYNGREVVRQVNLQVAPGRICGFLGPNGSGKTTTIRMLCGLLTPDAGEGQCLGLDIRQQAAAIKRQVGYMTQKFGLYEDLSIRENLDFVARLFELDQRRQRVDQALERLGLASRQKQLAGALSGGWKQRLALAACLLHEPRLLLLDEPTAGVDPKARRDFWDEIHHLAAEGITVLVSTHYMDEAERCHELVYIAYGEVLARGSAPQIVADSGLCVWSVQAQVAGADLAALVAPLKAAEGVLSVAAFGQSVHVAGRDPARLQAAIAPWQQRADLRWAPAEPDLEDVFINLIGRAADNFGPNSPQEAA